MALTASAPITTSRGDHLNDSDGFISKFEVVKTINAEPADGESKGVSAHTVISVGKCNDINLDADTGFIGMFAILRYTELLCTSDAASLKKCVASWCRRPTSTAIIAALLRRDRGASHFLRIEEGGTDVFVHPCQLLSNIEVGVSTRTWFLSAAAFALSYSQITKACEESPRDFANLDEHIEALQGRVNVLGSKYGIRKLVESALTSVKPPYADFDYTSVAHDVISRLSLLARADLAVMKHLKKQMPPQPRPERITALNVTVEQLRFLKDVSATNGDLWCERSLHTYELGEETGGVAVFPSGYLYSIIGGPGVSARKLLKGRTTLARMESIIPYIPYEFSGYSGDIGRIALLASQARKGASSKAYTRADLDVAKTAIATYAVSLAVSMIVDPLMIDLLRRADHKASDKSIRAVIPVPVLPEPVEEEEASEAPEDE